jgi:hypothetical protein
VASETYKPCELGVSRAPGVLVVASEAYREPETAAPKPYGVLDVASEEDRWCESDVFRAGDCVPELRFIENRSEIYENALFCNSSMVPLARCVELSECWMKPMNHIVCRNICSGFLDLAIGPERVFLGCLCVLDVPSGPYGDPLVKVWRAVSVFSCS